MPLVGYGTYGTLAAASKQNRTIKVPISFTPTLATYTAEGVDGTGSIATRGVLGAEKAASPNSLLFMAVFGAC